MPDLAELVRPDSKSGLSGVDSPDDDVTRRLVTEKKHEIGALREAEQTGLRDVAEDRTIAKQHLDAIGIQPGEFPKWDAQKQSEKFSTSPIEAFGSLGSVVGMLASAFTHAPMQNALNASAAAMDAIRVGDEREYNRAFSAWKENNELVFKRHELEQRAFDDAMRLGDRDMNLMAAKMRSAAVQFGANKDLIMMENGMWPELFEAKAKIKKAITDIQGYDNQLTQEKFAGEYLKMWDRQIDQQYPKGSVENAGAKLQAAQAASFMMGKDIGGQELGLWMAEEYKKTGQFPDSDARLNKLRQVSEAKSIRTGAHSADQEFVRRFYEQYPDASIEDFTKAFDEFKRGQKPASTGGALTTSKVNAQTLQDVKEDLKKQHPDWTDGQIGLEAVKKLKEAAASPVTGNQRLKEEAHIDQFENSIQTIDKVLNVLQTHRAAAGIAGKAMRLEERVTNILGSNNTERVQMMRDIELLRAMAPQLLLDRSGRPLSAEAAHTNDIVAGLSAGDTGPNTIRALKELKTRYEGMMVGAEKRLKGEWKEPQPGQKPTAPAARKSAPWANDPIEGR